MADDFFLSSFLLVFFSFFFYVKTSIHRLFSFLFRRYRIFDFFLDLREKSVAHDEASYNLRIIIDTRYDNDDDNCDADDR